MADYKPILIGAVLFLAVVLIWQVATITGAVTTVYKPSNATIGNSAPTVGTVTCTDAITLTACANVSAICYATVTDTNGYADISTVTGALYTGSGNTNPATGYAADANCVQSSPSGNTANYTCTFSAVRYFAQNGEWTGNLTATDLSSAVGYGTKTDVTVSELVAIDVTQSILEFGSLTPGATSTQQTSTQKNCGNKASMTVSVSGTDLGPCSTRGTIPVGQMTYNKTSGAAPAPGIALTTSPTDSTLAVARATSDTVSTGNLYWFLVVPTGVQGVCTGNVTFTGS